MTDPDDATDPSGQEQPDTPRRGYARQVAVAISDPGSGATPTVTATGHGALAERLLRIAFEHGVPVREDADLAEILEAMEVDTAIPAAAFAAVAEILSYVYRLNRGHAD